MRQILSFLNGIVNKNDIGATCGISCVIWAFILILFVLPFFAKYKSGSELAKKIKIFGSLGNFAYLRSVKSI